jgi:hypothetical protein
MDANISFIPLANAKCNTCGHLVAHAKQFHDGCHFTKGNDACPAKTFQIGVGVNVEKASQAIADALFNKDVIALQRHVNKLSGYKPVQTEQVLEAVFNKYALLHGLEIEDGEEEEDDGDEDSAEDAGDADESDGDTDGENNKGDYVNVSATATATATAIEAPAETGEAQAPAAVDADDDEWNDDALPGG